METDNSLTATKFKYAVLGLIVGAAIAASASYFYFDSITKAQLAQQAELELSSDALKLKTDKLRAKMSESQQQAVAEAADLNSQLQQVKADLAESEAQVESVKQQSKAEVKKLKSSYAAKIKAKEKQLAELQQKSDKQNEVIEQSKRFFQQQLTLQQELIKLNDERSKVIPLLNKATDECQIFLEGKSWDAKSDACDRKKRAADKLKQLDKQISAKHKKIKAIDATSEAIGLQQPIN